MAQRFFQNTMAINEELDSDEVTRTILKAAAAALKEVKANAVKHRDVSGGSIYVGLGGVGLTYLRMARQVQRGTKYVAGSYLQKHSVSHSLELAGRFLEEADGLMARKRVTFLEGASGLMACRAVASHMAGDAEATAAHTQELVGLWSSTIQPQLPSSECELLYGRAGYLYSLTWLMKHLGREAVPQDLVVAVVRHILDEGLEGAARLQQQQQHTGTISPPEATPITAFNTAAAASGGHPPPRPAPAVPPRWSLMYSWHNKHYLGAAHGICGILYVLLHHTRIIQQLDAQQQSAATPVAGSSGGSSGSGPYMSAVRATLEALVDSTLPSGNLPTKLGDREDVRVAWCHGAAGLIPLLLKAADVLGDPQGRFMAAASAAADDIWARGLLCKGVGLCHGISGNGYALLAMARATAAPHYLRAARGFALYAATHWQELYEVPDRPSSLYEGLAGAVNFWLDVIDPHHSCWPGAEL